MISLHRDTLTFTFPEIAREVRSLLDTKIKEVAAELPSIWDRIDIKNRVASRFSQAQRREGGMRARKVADMDVCGCREFLRGTGLESHGSPNVPIAIAIILMRQTLPRRAVEQ